MIKPEAIAAIAKAPAVTIAMLTLGSVATSRAEPAKYNFGCNTVKFSGFEIQDVASRLARIG